MFRIKFIFVFTFITSISFGQRNPFKLDSLIVGEWELTGIEIIADYIGSDTNSLKLQKSHDQKVVITRDSVHVDKAYSPRYYQNREQFHFYYEIQEGLSIGLYEGKKKKRRMINSFEVLDCDFETMILRNNHRLTKDLESASFYTIYTYKKKNTTTLSSELLKGEWFSCTDFSFLFPKDSITYEFTRIDSIENCWGSSSIEFKTRNFSNEFSITTKSGYTGVFSPSINYLLDFENKLFYVLLSNLTLAYSVDLIDDKLLLKLNREITEKINFN